MLERAEADASAAAMLSSAPVVVVDPDPDDADHDIGHQHRREPDDPQGAGERRAGEEAERQQQPAEHVERRCRRGEERRCCRPRFQKTWSSVRSSAKFCSADEVATSCGPMTCTLL